MKRACFAAVAAIAAATAFAWYQLATRLYINGNLASSGVIERNGSAYVPVRDVAEALKLTVQKTSRGYELTDAGGANQAKGINGKIGDVLWNGFVRFTVVKVIRTKEYTNQFSGDNAKVTPYPEGNDLVVIVCRIKNGMSKKITYGMPGGNETFLTDTDEHSFGPRTGMSMDAPSRGPELGPGAALDFALTFDVSPSAELKDLVYQTYFYDALNSDSGKKKFRVSVKQ